MTVHLNEDAGADVLNLAAPSAIPLPDDSSAKLYLRGSFPHYFVTNGCCGCGAVEGPIDGPGRLIPVRFVSDLLAVSPVTAVEVLWWWGDDRDKPQKPPRQLVPWEGFVRLNHQGQLACRSAYLIHGRPPRSA